MRLVHAATFVSTLYVAIGGASAQDLDPSKIRQPAGFAVPAGDQTLIDKGKSLFENAKLSTNDMACASCHADFGAFSDTFKKPYPHMVQMAKDRAGFDTVTAAEMVQLCMMVPMDAKPLAWDGTELASLTAYVEHLQREFAKKQN